MDHKLKESLKQAIDKGDFSKFKKNLISETNLQSELLFHALKCGQEAIAVHLLKTASYHSYF